MSACVALLAALASVAGWGERPTLLQLGGDESRGVLVNVTPGARSFDPPDPRRPTVAFVHGLNPAPRLVHFTMAERFSEALAIRGGPPCNLLSWNWNAATFGGLSMRANNEAAVDQGYVLAATLRGAGLEPARLHLIGHSSGSIVAASAALALRDGGGPLIGQLTLLEPASFYHALVFDRLAAGSSARRVENYWAPGPSAFGRAVPNPGVWNIRVTGPTPLLGTVWPLTSSHLYIFEWYIGTAANPRYPGGFNWSVLPQTGGR